MSNTAHLSALQVRLSHERVYLTNEKSKKGEALRRVWITQIEKEIECEKKFMNAALESEEIEMSDEELLAALEA